MKKPNVKNIVLIASAVAIIGVAFMVSKYENSVSANELKKNSLNSQNGMQIPTITALATSSDSGIIYSGNWQKTLSSSVAGVWGGSSTGSSSASSSQPLTPTEVFGRDIFTRYAQAQNAGQDVTDPNVQQAVASQILADGTVLPAPKVYTQKDIKIISNNSTSSLTQYGNTIANIFVNDSVQNQGLETDIVQNAINTKDPTVLKQLDPYIAGYQKIISDLITTPTPSNMTTMQIGLINAASELLFADQGFQKIYTDALTTLAGVNQYKDGVQDLLTNFIKIKKYFVDANITFDPTSNSKIFNIKK